MTGTAAVDSCVVFVGESFSSAILGRSSPGPDRFNDNRFSAKFEGTTVLLLLLLLTISAGAWTVLSVSMWWWSLSRSDVAVARQTVAELPLGVAFTTGGFPDDAQQSGDISVHLLSALRGCSRSGDRARRSNGDPGSAPFGRANPFFAWPNHTTHKTNNCYKQGIFLLRR